MMSGIGWGMGLGGGLWMFLVIVLLVVVFGILASAIATPPRMPSDDSTQILEARFARGEIAEAEYEQARRLLGIPQHSKGEAPWHRSELDS